MNRREFIAGLGGAATWPVVVRAQQGERVRRIGVLMNLAVDDPESQTRIAAFQKELLDLGWVPDRSARFDIRWATADAERYRRYAAELVSLAPDVILATGAPSVLALQQVTHAIPIVFANVVDPVGAGIVASLARPGGNATGFTQFEFGMSAKWAELLKEIAPLTKRAAVLRDPSTSGGLGLFGAIQSVAPSFGLEVRPIDVRDAGEIERAISEFGRGSDGGLIVTQNAYAVIHREQIITLAARYRLPTVYAYRLFVTSGGLISYGPDISDVYRGAAGYVDRILKGEMPKYLPVQTPTKFELAINARTAKALGITVPPSLLARADEVIE